MRTKTAILVLSALCLPAYSELATLESIEWVVDSSHAIATYEITTVKPPPKGNYANIYTLKQKSILKGKPAKEFQHNLYGGGCRLNKLKLEAGSEVMVFFAKRPNKTLAVRYHVSLSSPNPQGKTPKAITKKSTVLTTKQAIIQNVKDRVKLNRQLDIAYPGKINVYTTHPFPGGGFIKVFSALKCRDAIVLLIPLDSEVKERLFKEAKSMDSSLRREAAYNLAAVPGPESVKILKTMLKDPTQEIITYYQLEKNEKTGEEGMVKKTLKCYPVRHVAYASLKIMGEKVEKPEGYNKKVAEYFSGFLSCAGRVRPAK